MACALGREALDRFRPVFIRPATVPINNNSPPRCCISTQRSSKCRSPRPVRQRQIPKPPERRVRRGAPCGSPRHFERIRRFSVLGAFTPHLGPFTPHSALRRETLLTIWFCYKKTRRVLAKWAEQNDNNSH